MGSVVAAIVKKTAANSGVSALVGSRVSVFGDHASHAAGGLPYITVQQVGGEDADHIAGHASLAEATVQINCVGASYTNAQQVRAAVLAAWRGSAPESVSLSAGSVSIRSAHVSTQADIRSGPNSGRDAPLFINTLDLTVWYSTT